MIAVDQSIYKLFTSDGKYHKSNFFRCPLMLVLK